MVSRVSFQGLYGRVSLQGLNGGPNISGVQISCDSTTIQGGHRGRSSTYSTLLIRGHGPAGRLDQRITD